MDRINVSCSSGMLPLFMMSVVQILMKIVPNMLMILSKDSIGAKPINALQTVLEQMIRKSGASLKQRIRSSMRKLNTGMLMVATSFLLLSSITLPIEVKWRVRQS